MLRTSSKLSSCHRNFKTLQRKVGKIKRATIAQFRFCDSPGQSRSLFQSLRPKNTILESTRISSGIKHSKFWEIQRLHRIWFRMLERLSEPTEKRKDQHPSHNAQDSSNWLIHGNLLSSHWICQKTTQTSWNLFKTTQTNRNLFKTTFNPHSTIWAWNAGFWFKEGAFRSKIDSVSFSEQVWRNSWNRRDLWGNPSSGTDQTTTA